MNDQGAKPSPSRALDGDQRARLLEIAKECSVHRTLTFEIVSETRITPGSVS